MRAYDRLSFCGGGRSAPSVLLSGVRAATGGNVVVRLTPATGSCATVENASVELMLAPFVSERERAAAVTAWEGLIDARDEQPSACIVSFDTSGPAVSLTAHLASLRSAPNRAAALRGVAERVAAASYVARLTGRQLSPWGGTPVVTPDGDILTPDLEPLEGEGDGVLRAMRILCRYMYGRKSTSAAFAGIYDRPAHCV